MKRREFITLLGGTAAAWPLAARAQQPADRMRHIGVLMTLQADDPEAQARLSAFVQGLKELGRTDGRNIQIDFRFDPDIATTRKHAAELVALVPNVILANGSAAAEGSRARSLTERPRAFLGPGPGVIGTLLLGGRRPGSTLSK